MAADPTRDGMEGKTMTFWNFSGGSPPLGPEEHPSPAASGECWGESGSSPPDGIIDSSHSCSAVCPLTGIPPPALQPCTIHALTGSEHFRKERRFLYQPGED